MPAVQLSVLCRGRALGQHGRSMLQGLRPTCQSRQSRERGTWDVGDRRWPRGTAEGVSAQPRAVGATGSGAVGTLVPGPWTQEQEWPPGPTLPLESARAGAQDLGLGSGQLGKQGRASQLACLQHHCAHQSSPGSVTHVRTTGGSPAARDGVSALLLRQLEGTSSGLARGCQLSARSHSSSLVLPAALQT